MNIGIEGTMFYLCSICVYPPLVYLFICNFRIFKICFDCDIVRIVATRVKIVMPECTSGDPNSSEAGDVTTRHWFPSCSHRWLVITYAMRCLNVLLLIFSPLLFWYVILFWCYNHIMSCHVLWRWSCCVTSGQLKSIAPLHNIVYLYVCIYRITIYLYTTTSIYSHVYTIITVLYGLYVLPPGVDFFLYLSHDLFLQCCGTTIVPVAIIFACQLARCRMMDRLSHLQPWRPWSGLPSNILQIDIPTNINPTIINYLWLHHPKSGFAGIFSHLFSHIFFPAISLKPQPAASPSAPPGRGSSRSSPAASPAARPEPQWPGLGPSRSGNGMGRT